MAEKSSDPPGLRASVVDSGWEPESPKGRELPRYEEAPRDALITRVDDQIQSRIAAMNAPDEPRRHTDVTVPDAVYPNLLPPVDERTLVDKPPFTSSLPPPNAPPPPLPVSDAPPVPSLAQALGARVRVAGGVVPLWATLAPVLLVTALLAALMGGAVGGGPDTSSEGREGAAASAEGMASAAPPGSAASPPSLPGAPQRAQLLSPAALSALEKKSPKELGTEEAVAIATTKAMNAQAEVRALSERLATDPGLAKDPAIVTKLLAFAHQPETARDALSAMAKLPGALSADLLYEVWTGTAERSDATELARALLLGRDVRPKASPALAVALELREAETCEANAKLLARATEIGDKRSLAPLTRLFRKTGCGPGKRQDCYPCLREGEALRDALVAAKKRREPDLGAR